MKYIKKAITFIVEYTTHVFILAIAFLTSLYFKITGDKDL